MKNLALVLVALAAAAAPTADAFGVGRGIGRAAAAVALDRGALARPSDAAPAAVVRVRGASSPSPWSALRMASSPSAGEKIVIDKDFRLSALFLAGGLLLDRIPLLQVTLGPIVTLLGVLFLVQTFRINFVCDDATFSLQENPDEGDAVGENVVVGGENRWTYDSFVNYDFFPEGWIDQPQGPILVYFKETQTPSDKWNEGPGAGANSEEALAKGAVKGQVHFFPALCDTQQLRSVWRERNCGKL